jgi:hypothetical protein
MVTMGFFALISWTVMMMTAHVWPTLGGAGGSSCAIAAGWVWILAQPFLVMRVRAFSNSFSMFLASSVLLAVGLVCSFIFFGTSANAVFDRSAPQTVEASVVKKEMVRSKSTSYHVTVDPGAAGPVTKLNVSSGEYLITGDRVNLKLRDGFMGWTWVQDVDFRP